MNAAPNDSFLIYVEVFSSQEQISFLITAKVNDALRYHLDSARFHVLQNVTRLELLKYVSDLSYCVLHYSQVKIIMFWCFLIDQIVKHSRTRPAINKGFSK